MLQNWKKIYLEFPRQFWLVVGVSFIDRVGGTLLFPFFALYITQRFSVGMTQAGIILGLFSISSLVGGLVGGGLTDRFGRRNLIIFGLVFSAISTLTLGYVPDFDLLFPLAIVIGFLSDIAGPAHQAMIADLLPERQRQEGYGIMRVVGNMAWIIGPTIGGFVANRSFLALFITDAIVSSIVALLFFLFLKETKPKDVEGEEPQGLGATFAGYIQVLKDIPYVAYIGASILMGIVYIQMYNSLSVFLRDQHGLSPQGYGIILTTSAVTVIFFQFRMTRLIKTRPPFLMMAIGTIFYLIGFGMYGVVGIFGLFMAAMVVITIGEMIVVPTGSTLAANFAPAAMRGRYMAVFSFVWALPATIGPAAAGYILDNAANPNLLWFAGALLCAISALGFFGLHLWLGKRKRFSGDLRGSTAE
jgi:MFS family permease